MTASSFRVVPMSLAWIIATIAGGFVYLSTVMWVGLADGDARVLIWILGGIVSGLLSGMVVGFGQWLVIRSSKTIGGRWIWATAIGWGIGGGIWFLLLEISVEVSFSLWQIPITLLVAGVGSGAAIGIGQWLVMRSRVGTSWITVTAISWLLGWGAVLVIGLFGALLSISFNPNSFGFIAVIWVIVATIAGLISGSYFVKRVPS